MKKICLMQMYDSERLFLKLGIQRFLIYKKGSIALYALYAPLTVLI